MYLTSVHLPSSVCLSARSLCESRPTPHISWTKISGDLPSKRTSFLNYNKTLHIEDVSASDEGDYRCTAKNQFGSVHHTIHVMVKGVLEEMLSSHQTLSCLGTQSLLLSTALFSPSSL